MKSINFVQSLFVITLLIFSTSLFGQGVGINDDNSSPDASAALDVKSTTKGMLIPRMTTVQRTAIATPATSLLVFDTDLNAFWFYDGSAWADLGAGDNLGNHTATANLELNNNWLSNDGGNEGIAVENNGDVYMGALTTSDGNGLAVQNYTSGKAAIYGADQNGTNVYAYGMIGVLSPSSLGIPITTTNIGVLGVKPNRGGDGAAVYGWNNDAGTNNYASLFVADGTTGTNYGVYASADSGATANYGGYFLSPSTTGTSYGIYASGVDAAAYLNGEVGIRTADPLTDVHLTQSNATIAGTGGMRFQYTSSYWKIFHSGSHFSFVDDGVRVAYVEAGTGNYVQPSDMRLKKNITPITGVLGKLTQLRPVRYHYNQMKDTDQKAVGFLAQEVEQIFPEVVRESEDGNKALSYTDFAVLSVQAIKEQQTQIEKLQKENDTIKKELEEIKALLKNMNK